MFQQKSKSIFLVNEGMYLLQVIKKLIMHFVKILKLLLNFGVVVKKIHINYKIHLETSNFFIVCENHNEKHYGK
jgi:predicted acetyltransferase